MRFPYAEVEFNADGSVHDPAQMAAAAALVRPPGITDVLVLAHGWNNDIPRARRLYDNLTDQIDNVRGQVPEAAGRSFAVVGVLWPALRWADEDEVAGGGGASFGGPAGLDESIDGAVHDSAVAQRLKRLAPALETSPEARTEFLRTLSAQLPPPIPDDEDPPPTTLVEGDEETVFAAAGGPEVDLFAAPDAAGGATAFGLDAVGGAVAEPAAGGAVGLFGGGNGFLRGARNLLNLTTYYTMKDRAGRVGSGGVAALLDALAVAAPGVRRHLAGHSFGARVVSAAASRHRPVHSITLLQAAFSHHGFATNYDDRGGNGFFRSVLDPGRLAGPLVVTHTANDRAVGVAYAIASRLAGHAAAEFGGPDDRYGGLGRNGAVKTPQVAQPATDLLEVGGGYAFGAGRVHNLKADRFIASHGSVTGPQVAYALLRAMVTG